MVGTAQARLCPPYDYRHHPRKRMIQYSAPLMVFRDGGDYWIPAFAGMTVLG
jgi:hypothetical protein